MAHEHEAKNQKRYPDANHAPTKDDAWLPFQRKFRNALSIIRFVIHFRIYLVGVYVEMPP